MNTFNIFEDSDCTLSVDMVLFEGRTYFITLPEMKSEIIRAEIQNAGLDRFISWHKKNAVASMTIINYVGYIRLFGRVFDVRSEKLKADETGKQQFENLLDDLTRLSNEIIFDYTSPTNAGRVPNKKIPYASILERFGYYKQLVIDLPPGQNLESLINAILRNPHAKLVTQLSEDFIWNVRKPTQKLAKMFSKNAKQIWEVPWGRTQSHLKNGSIHQQRERLMLPVRVPTVKNVQSFDTMENRFVKHVLRDIENVCIVVARLPKMPAKVRNTCDVILDKVRAFLRMEFFFTILNLNILPTSSPTLTARHGYKELFSHFIKSRVAAKHIFDDFKKQSFLVDLKNVALLYEYWVFYKVVKALLGNRVKVESTNIVVKNGLLVHGIKVSKGNISIAFNQSFTRGRQQSYSLTLRPDVVVEITGGSKKILVLFDAKYRRRSIEIVDQDDPDQSIELAAVLSDDLHKMHCYLDAITEARCAFAVYPGTEFVFYHRDHVVGMMKNLDELRSLDGVGGVPLLPGGGDFEKHFNAVMTYFHRLADNHST